VHDAFLVGGPLERLDRDVALMEFIMQAAGRAVTGGLTVRTEATVVRAPGRYMDDRGKEMWDVVMRLLARRGAADQTKRFTGEAVVFHP
jgi:hypothetical protein